MHLDSKVALVRAVASGIGHAIAELTRALTARNRRAHGAIDHYRQPRLARALEPSSGQRGYCVMSGRLSNELREIVWLAWVAGSLTMASTTLAVAAAFVLEHLA